jgi:prepilin-type N-terminal cleavage/methylation domain-containing protein/prepilin-type processing-associated H-X9-DG protein
MNRRKGFTLIELLVVIAIIAVLMSILMPSLNRVRKQAKAVACMAQLRNWALYFNYYTNDNDGRFNEGHARSGRGLWPAALRPYYKDQLDLLLCPDATKEVYDGLPGAFGAVTRTFYKPDDTQEELLFSYGINNWVNYNPSGRGASRPGSYFWLSTKNVKQRDQVPVFGDCTWHDGWPQDIDEPPTTDIAVGAGNFGITNEMQQFAIPRHANGTINMLFMDWSARKVGLKELWTLKWHREFDTANAWTLAGRARPEDWPKWMHRFSDY